MSQKVEVVQRAIWLAVLVLLASAASASALPLRKLGPGSIWTDGTRYAVFFPAEQAWWPAQVYDERAGRRYTVNTPTVPPAPGFQTPPICRFYAVAGGSVLWSCPFGEPPYLLTELATGVTRAVPGWHRLERSLSQFEHESDVLGPGLRGFGRRWLHIQLYGAHELLANRWLDWRTGTLVKNEPGGARDVIDLDDSRLAVPLCEPLRRRIERSDGSGLDIVIPYVYEHGWLFDSSYSVQSHAIKVHRCGRRRPLVLHRCRHFCSSASFGAGYVTWLDEKKFSIFDPTPISRDQTVVFAYDVRRHRRFGFRANFGLQWPLYLWHTRKHIYAHTAFTSPTLYVGRLPERH
jgi:hypothetical protein